MNPRLLQLARRVVSAPGPRPVSHFYAIDFARGLAALAVLVWHYQHFFYAYAGSVMPPSLRTSQPLYALLSPLYREGHRAVQFFWLISGFVFTAVYAAGGAPARGGGRDFIVNRFARLYPLHLLTFVVVALLQLVSSATVGHQQIYPNNDLKNFLLNIFMSTRWGLGDGDSFNGPIWSVSIELLVYVLFWVTLPIVFRFGVLGPALIAAVAQWLYIRVLGPEAQVMSCVFYFYLGACVYGLGGALRRSVLPVAISLGVASIGVFICGVHPDRREEFGIPLLMSGALLLLFALELSERGRRFEALRWIGDNTYGTYLWHVPIQIATLIVLDRFVCSRAIAYSPFFLIGFLVLTMLVARVSFLCFERPAREWLRARLGSRRRASASTMQAAVRSPTYGGGDPSGSWARFRRSQSLARSKGVAEP